MTTAGKHLVFIHFVLVTAVLFGCAQKPSGGRAVAPKTGAVQNKKTVVSYEIDIKPLLKKSCVSCHSGTQKPSLTTYTEVKKAAKIVHASVRDGVMPQAKKDRWSAKEVELVRLWIAGGHLKTTPVVSTKPKDELADEKEEDPEEEDPIEEEKPKITYDLKVKKIMNSYCLMCHGTGGNLPELDTKEKVIAAGDAVLDSVQTDRMPKTGSLRASDKDIIKSWVEGGKL